jgi:asparagine synthase (glutamine-hydrolysing)
LIINFYFEFFLRDAFMCGISGILSWQIPPQRDLIERMNQRMIHRGPDADGIYVNSVVGLGHRRLAIIDLSAAGQQPMADHSERFRIVFNGEIYNYQAIRSELSRLGAVFRSRSDTEVILEAYKQWGIDCLSRFNGMFAFALWDDVRQQLFLARDRLGEKPLFYHLLPAGGIAFASEMKALQPALGSDATLNFDALSHYLSLGYTLNCAPILTGVAQLEAAHYLVIERDRRPQPVCYWNLAEHFHCKQRFRNELEAAEALSALIDDTVKLRLIADVPLGSFLSGGVDSSAVVAAMGRLRPYPLPQTFSIGFQEKSYSELPEARAVARYLQAEHCDRIVDADMATLLPKIAWHADQPFADSSMIPMYFLAEFARSQVTVCLSGDGNDEIFAGYETFSADKLHYWTRWVPQPVIDLLSWAAHTLVPTTHHKVSFDYKLRQFLRGHAYPPLQAHYFWRTLFSDAEKQRLMPDQISLLAEADPYREFQRYQQDVLDCHYLDQAMYVDIKTWLADDILVKVDRSTMAHSLEARVPFLDHRLVEFGASLPVHLKMKGWQKKYIFKQSQKQYLPKATLTRKKSGFNAPVAHWLASSLHHFGEQLCDRNRGESALPFLNSAFIRHLQQEHDAKAQDHAFKLLALINLHLWYQASGLSASSFSP